MLCRYDDGWTDGIRFLLRQMVKRERVETCNLSSLRLQRKTTKQIQSCQFVALLDELQPETYTAFMSSSDSSF